MTRSIAEQDYLQKVAAESHKWADHLMVEASGEWNAWLDHPLIQEHYRGRGLIAGAPWEEWVKIELGGPARRSLDLGCGSGSRSMAVFKAGSSQSLHGFDVSADRISEAERIRDNVGASGSFRVGDINGIELPPSAYDLIFSAHSFHHFIELEHIMEQVHDALTPRGLFILEEYVGPTQLQWSDGQMDLTRSILSLIPERFRMYRTGILKNEEGRPTPEEVEAVSPFESIRSAEILPLFASHFDVVTLKPLGGTIQHLLYNGIVHNFKPEDEEAVGYIESIFRIEDALIDGDLLPSDFMLLIGRRKNAPARREMNNEEHLKERVAEMERRLKSALAQVAETERATLELRVEVRKREQELGALSERLAEKEAELQRMKNTLGWRLLSRFGRIKYRYLLPLYRLLGLMPAQTKSAGEGGRETSAGER